MQGGSEPWRRQASARRVCHLKGSYTGDGHLIAAPHWEPHDACTPNDSLVGEDETQAGNPASEIL